MASSSVYLIQCREFDPAAMAASAVTAAAAAQYRRKPCVDAYLGSKWRVGSISARAEGFLGCFQLVLLQRGNPEKQFDSPHCPVKERRKSIWVSRVLELVYGALSIEETAS